MRRVFDMTSPRRAGSVLYIATITFLMGAIVVTFLQKHRESEAATAWATGGNVQQAIQGAEHWRLLSNAAIALSILFWSIVIWRREARYWAWVPVVLLLSFYVLLQLMMV